ncbi:MAG: UDP-2,4-diacetamido-2,4,6-trideoxy-beta-L-altropyranose hydrolase [Blautia sp.]|nr:UDP-2,4-diacetamido-2,4,6-trideoxy-beta-L-altropyranose hydrolase [Lachnoclostridium sp.]MCM1212272.1 UDP-2,4-diacetamido-2,4,6-trideoxy-beta-L-altropyranose hydrolase [Blautia sp.]
MPTIYFRTDGNKEIATGHLMRCLSIARACATLQADIIFLVSDQTSQILLQERFLVPDEFPIRCLNSDYRKPDLELPALLGILQGASSETSLLFLDSYFVTKTYLEELKAYARTAYLDDILAFDYPVDMIINYDITERPDCYQQAAHALLGATYTPLRKQFSEVSYEVRPKVHHVLLSTGGTDTFSVAGMLLEKIYDSSSARTNDTNVTNDTIETSTLQSFHYHIITSRLNEHFTELERFSALHPNVHIHEQVQDMASLMCQCDLAVSAGGTTLYELCAVGVPAISFATADNQLHAVHTFMTQAGLPYAGDVRISPDQTIGAILRFLSENGSYSKRKESSHTMRAFVDGKGSSRIAAALLSLISS